MKTNEGAMLQGGGPFRLCLYFALNPHEELYTKDVIDKFDIPMRSVHTVFNSAIISGWIARRSQGRGRGHTNVYAAGPKLLEAIGAHHQIPS